MLKMLQIAFRRASTKCWSVGLSACGESSSPASATTLQLSLFDEVSWATEDEPTEELRKSFRVKHYLIVSKFYKLKNIGQKKRKGKDDEDEVIYIKPEDEIFHKLSWWSFIYPSSIQQPTTNEASSTTISLT